MRPLPFFIGFRYGIGGSSNQLVSFLSRLSMVGLILGVALLVTVMSVMNGFDKEMRQRILSLVPHITMQPWTSGEGRMPEHWQSLQASVEQHPEVIASAPFLQGNALLVKGQRAEPVLFFGIDPALEPRVSTLGNFVDLKLLSSDTENGLVLGAVLAQKLGLSVGDRVTLAVPGSGGGRGVKFRPFSLVAVAATGTELDQQLVMMNLQQAARLLPDQGMALRVSVADVFAAPRVAWELNMVHGGDYLLRDWSQQFGNMYHAIQMSRRLVVIMLFAVVAVAVFNVVSTLVLVVNDKRGDIAILRSQGARRRDILLIFIIYGGLIGTIGAALGAALGVGLSLVIGDLVALVERLFSIQLLHSDVYPISYLPADIRSGDVLLLCGVAIAMSFLATLYPAWRASRQSPAEALQHG